MDMIGRIRRLHSRKNKSVREIARITGLSRNTISKWLTAEIEGAPKYRRGEQSSKLTAFHDALRQALKADARRPRHERRTARLTFRGSPNAFARDFPGLSGIRSGLARCFKVDEAFSLLFPGSHELSGFAVVADGLLQHLGLLRRHRAVHEHAILHVSPFVVGAVPG
jgi:transcriptional regulator with XRE-family HTH domain